MQPDVSMLTVREQVGKALTNEEEQTILDACSALRSRALLPIVTLALHTGMRRGEIQSLQWFQVDFMNRTVTVGATKTEAGTGRVIPLNHRAFATLQNWATNFADRKSEPFVFPSEHYGIAGNDRKVHAKTVDPNQPIGEIKTGWETAKKTAGVKCRFHDLRHTACTRLLERGAPLPVVASIMGWSASTTAKMAKRYGHIGSDVQRIALDALSATGRSGEKPNRSAGVPATSAQPN